MFPWTPLDDGQRLRTVPHSPAILPSPRLHWRPHAIARLGSRSVSSVMWRRCVRAFRLASGVVTMGAALALTLAGRGSGADSGELGTATAPTTTGQITP